MKTNNSKPKKGGLFIATIVKANAPIQEKNHQPKIQNSRFNKRIGSVTYEVGVHFKKGATETMDKKIMRLIKNEMGAVS